MKMYLHLLIKLKQIFYYYINNITYNKFYSFILYLL